ncbi:MAG: phosphoglycerate kinase [Candidatus Moranbacteria bacterium]|nr:phosphoglycerate kinase [Candidatus Moranbacteria bacterium]
MEIKKIQNGNFDGKKVLVRADFNVAIKDGKPQEKFKLEACKETVQYLTSQEGVKIAITSHFGRPEGKRNFDFSLAQLINDLEEIIEKKIIFVDDCVGKKVSDALDFLEQGEVLLLENVRFHAGEETNDEVFAKELGENFDAYVNDAFSVCHRNQASVTGVTKYIPSYAGFWLQKEIQNLDRVAKNPALPATAIIGGAKIETKLPLINVLESSYTNILVGGKIANEAIEQTLKFSPKVLLPVDFAQEKFDIGEKTIEIFKDIISKSKVIVWNGPMGKFEQKPFDNGTNEILKTVIESGAFTLIGGGESVQILEEKGLMDKVSFVSTGGGAMLEYLSGESMPGIEALRENQE